MAVDPEASGERMTLEERIARVVARSRAFFDDPEPGRYLVVANVPAATPALPPLSSFDLDRELEKWLDLKLDASRPMWRAKQDIDDDSIPLTCPHFGIAEHSAWLGMDVHLQEATCLPKPMVVEKSDLQKLRPDPTTKWFGIMQRGYEYLRSRKDGTFVLGVRGTMAPMDLANAVRGDELFYDFVDDPDFSHALMQRLTDLIPWYFDQLLSWCDEIEGGHAFMLGNIWMPNGTLGHLSNDAAMLCRSDVYEQFGYPYERPLIARYGRGLYHVHNQKMHYIPQLVRLPGLALLEVSHDPKTPPLLKDLGRILEATQSVRLMLSASSDDIRRHLPDLRGRSVCFLAQCTDAGDAADLVRLIRDRSRK
jgi:hypothetical protein